MCYRQSIARNNQLDSRQICLDLVSVRLAECAGDWNLHKSAFAAMLPWFAQYDHTNYTRWGAVYLADAMHLEASHPDVYREFLSKLRGEDIAQPIQPTVYRPSLGTCQQTRKSSWWFGWNNQIRRSKRSLVPNLQ